jgi:hypothetical protein
VDREAGRYRRAEQRLPENDRPWACPPSLRNLAGQRSVGADTEDPEDNDEDALLAVPHRLWRPLSRI